MGLASMHVCVLLGFVEGLGAEILASMHVCVLPKLSCLQRICDSLPKLSLLQRISIRCRVVCCAAKL